MYGWSPVWLVRIKLFTRYKVQHIFLSNWRSALQWYFPLQHKWVYYWQSKIDSCWRAPCLGQVDFKLDRLVVIEFAQFLIRTHQVSEDQKEIFLWSVCFTLRLEFCLLRNLVIIRHFRLKCEPRHITRKPIFISFNDVNFCCHTSHDEKVDLLTTQLRIGLIRSRSSVCNFFETGLC